ncbi:ABC transporter substrate-binding protein [Pelagibacterium montanilacus]|uniref:ABC transporter substrate-binding protein n=1 Tax=Pelagibacterium montanilacus TaxID=2185280 RepID=UPI000F8CE4E1|nr:ABC transporter substrate-binding protein [Pelagibacterium montanilacus]
MTRSLAAIALLAVLAAPASGREETVFAAPGQETETLVIEASADLEAIAPLILGFQETAPEVTIRYADSLTNEVFASAMDACTQAENFADIVISSSVDHIARLTNDGCAQRHDSPFAQAIPEWANWRNEAFGFSFEPAVMVYNSELVPPEDVPLTRNALVELLRTQPETYDGRVGTYDITRSGIGYLFAFFDAQQSSVFGRLLEGFGRAGAVLAPTTGDILDRIESGQLLVGYNLLGSYAYGRLREGAPLGIVLPHDFTIVLSRAALIPVHAANRTTAGRFIDYLLSPAGQDVAAGSSFFFGFDRPPPPDVTAADDAGGATFYRPIVLSPSLLVTLDQAKRARFLAEWNDALGTDR